MVSGSVNCVTPGDGRLSSCYVVPAAARVVVPLTPSPCAAAERRCRGVGVRGDRAAPRHPGTRLQHRRRTRQSARRVSARAPPRYPSQPATVPRHSGTHHSQPRSHATPVPLQPATVPHHSGTHHSQPRSHATPVPVTASHGPAPPWYPPQPATVPRHPGTRHSQPRSHATPVPATASNGPTPLLYPSQPATVPRHSGTHHSQPRSRHSGTRHSQPRSRATPVPVTASYGWTQIRIERCNVGTYNGSLLVQAHICIHRVRHKLCPLHTSVSNDGIW